MLAMQSGSGMSGSTAWHNAVRSRLYLTRPVVDEGQELDDFERILSRKKANYAGSGDSISLRWNKGVFVAQMPEAGVFGTIERRTADKAFLEALDALTAQGRIAGHSRSSPSYAPKLMVSMPETNGFNRLSLLKTSYPVGTLAFPANAGYLLRHANDSLSPPGHSP